MTSTTSNERTPLLPSTNNKTSNLPWHKVDIVLLPLVAGFFLLAFVDRINIGNARAFGMQEKVEFTDAQYSLALMLTWIPYIALMIPATFLLKATGALVALPSMALLWGIASLTQGFAHGPLGLIGCRVCLGLAQGGFIPCIVLYASEFYPKDKLPKRIALCFSISTFAGAFSGLLAAVLMQLDGLIHQPGWAWVLILEGTVTVILAFIAAVVLPESIAEVSGLTEQEKASMNRLVKVQQSSEEVDEDPSLEYAPVTFTDFVKVLKMPHVLMISAASFLSGIVELTFAFFAPEIVEKLGYNGVEAQLMSVPPFALAFLLALVSIQLSDRCNARGIAVILFAILTFVGLTLFIGGNYNSILTYISLLIVIPGSFCVTPLLASWTLVNTRQANHRAISVGILSIASAIGGIIAAWIVGPHNWNGRQTGYTSAVGGVLLACELVQFVAVGATMRWFGRRNKEAGRAVYGL